jgi:hypothetical protein
LLELEIENAAMFGLTLHLPLFRQPCRLDRHGLDGTNEFPGERRIDAKPTEHHTPGCAKRRVAAVASIDGLAGASGVYDTQPPAAPTTRQQAAEQGAATATGLGTIFAAIGIGGKLRLIAFELFPVDVAFVMILQQDLALLERPVVPIGLASPAIDDLGSIDAFAIGVSTGVKWILQQRDDIAISDWRPIERRHPLAVRRAREMHALDFERQMHLPGAAQFTEALENPAGDLLDAAIRIETQTDLPMPNIADRHGDSEFPSPGFRPRGVEHP